VVGFGCGKVHNLGGRGEKMKKRGSNVWGLFDLLKMLTIPSYHVGNSTSIAVKSNSRTTYVTLSPYRKPHQ